MNVTATGFHLDSVKYPKLVVKISLLRNTKVLELLEDCWSNPESRGSLMTCRTPALPKLPRVAVPTSSSPLLTHVAFIMDGVQRLKDLNIHQEDMSRLWYYPDPVFEEVRRTGQRTLVIKGTYLQLFNLEDFQITLGKDYPCKIIDFSVEYLTCEIPLTVLENSNFYDTKISVEVVIGYSRYQIGFVMIEKPEDETVDPPPNPVWWTLLVLIPICLIAITFICLKYCKKKTLDPADKNKQGNRPINLANVDRSAAFVQNFNSATQEESVRNHNSEMAFVDAVTLAILENMNLIIPKSCLVIGENIGAGQFGCVFEGMLQRHEETKNVKVAIKTLRKHSWSNPQTVEDFLKEALIMKDFDHPNVLSLLGVCFKGCGPSIVLPFMDNGDLCSYIKDETKVLLVTNLLKFAIDIAAGMTYLGEKKFLHRDLAARNCILDSTLNVKVADFGLSRDVYVNDYYCCDTRNAKLPYKWMAPESIEKQLYSTKTDVWSYGVLLWELMTRGRIPYANVSNWLMLEYIQLGHRLDQPERCPISMYRIMLACWNRESKERPTFSLLHECISYIRQRILNRHQKDVPPKNIPPQNTIYYANELTNNGRELTNNSKELTNNSKELTNNSKELTNNDKELKEKGKELKNNGNEMMTNGNGPYLGMNGYELSNSGKVFTNKGKELMKNGYELPNNGNELMNDGNGPYLNMDGYKLPKYGNGPYLRMDNYVLRKGILEESSNLENEYLDMSKNTLV